jgi:ATP-dependent DNA helicase RecG
VRAFSDLFSALQASDETTQIEAKKASDVGKALLFTITSFSNEPGMGGGYFVLGVVKSAHGVGYEAVGVPDPDKLQRDIAAHCATDFNIPLRPEIAVEVVDEKSVLVVHIPEVDPNEKPVFHKKTGLPQGACRRIGSTDQHCTEDDIARLIQLRDEHSYDATVVRGAAIEDLDPAAIKEYRETRLNQDAAELRLKIGEMLIAIGAAVRKKSGELGITRAGLLLFGKQTALRRLSPSSRIDYILVAGQDWVPDTAQPLKSTEVRQALLLAVPRIANLILQDLPTTIVLKGKGLRRKERPAIPERVIREAVVNAVMHRSYRAQNPIQIIRFSNRIEIRNPGHSLVATDELGNPGSRTRNEQIAAVLHDCGYAETKGTGIRVMRQQMHDANMTEPIFRSSRQDDSFEVTLFSHNLLDEETIKWLSRFESLNLTQHEAKALVLVRNAGYIDNANYRNINAVDVLTASNALRRLRDVGLLAAHNKGTATFYTPTSALLQPLGPGHKGVLSPRLNSGDKETQPLQLSPAQVGLLRRIGERSADKRLLEIAILSLCAIRPLTLTELMRYVKRSPDHLRKRLIGPMLKSGTLQYLYPESPAHPNQAYSAAPWMTEIEIPEENKKARKKNAKSREPETGSLF